MGIYPGQIYYSPELNEILFVMIHNDFRLSFVHNSNYDPIMLAKAMGGFIYVGELYK